jgi:hypothetical protein
MVHLKARVGIGNRSFIVIILDKQDETAFFSYVYGTLFFIDFKNKVTSAQLGVFKNIYLKVLISRVISIEVDGS